MERREEDEGRQERFLTCYICVYRVLATVFRNRYSYSLRSSSYIGTATLTGLSAAIIGPDAFTCFRSKSYAFERRDYRDSPRAIH